jgi:hypothetical protein
MVGLRKKGKRGKRVAAKAKRKIGLKKGTEGTLSVSDRPQASFKGFAVNMTAPEVPTGLSGRGFMVPAQFSLEKHRGFFSFATPAFTDTAGQLNIKKAASPFSKAVPQGLQALGAPFAPLPATFVPPTYPPSQFAINEQVREQVREQAKTEKLVESIIKKKLRIPKSDDPTDSESESFTKEQVMKMMAKQKQKQEDKVKEQMSASASIPLPVAEQADVTLPIPPSPTLGPKAKPKLKKEIFRL